MRWCSTSPTTSRTPRAQRTKATIELAAKLPDDALRLALTGTPVLNRPEELVSQLRAIGRLGDFGSGARLSRRFRDAGSDDRLHWNLRAHCYVRRTKDQVLPQLPSKRHDTVPVPLSNEDEYRLAEQDVIAWLQTLPLDLKTLDAKVAAALRSEQLVRLNNLRQLAAAGKLPTALSWIADFLESGEPLVVFAEHVATQRAVLRALPRLAHILGADSSTRRQAAVDAFQDEDGPQLIVCSLKAASQGITLTRASNVAFLELDWTPARHDQAEDRLHRIGQESAVTAWYLLAPDTIDETMGELLDRKRSVINAVTDGQVATTSGRRRRGARPALARAGRHASGGLNLVLRAPGRATWAGSWSATAPSTRTSTAGTSASRGSSRRSSATTPSGPTGTRNSAWIAEVDGQRAGSIFLVEDEPGTARLRLLLVEPAARGEWAWVAAWSRRPSASRGGRGTSEVVLWTNDVLASARPIYEAAGVRARRRGAPFALRPGGRRPGLATSPRRIVLGPLRWRAAPSPGPTSEERA